MAGGGGPATGAGPSPAAPERLATGDVALLVDWENLKIGLERMRITPNVTALYDASRDYGRVVVARAYADWLERDMHADPPALYRAGLEPVYVPKRKIALSGAPSAIVKNSGAVPMAVDGATPCPGYDPRTPGYKSLRRLMQAAKEKGVIAGIETIDVQDWAFLKGHAQALKQVLRER